jgi:Mor family transcriptional regulator
VEVSLQDLADQKVQEIGEGISLKSKQKKTTTIICGRFFYLPILDHLTRAGIISSDFSKAST